MTWEENSCICLHMQLIAILSRIGVKLYIKSVKCGFIHVTYFCNKRLYMYVSALQLPVSAFSKAFDCKDSANERNVSSLTNCRVQPILCKDTEKKQNGIQLRLTPRGFSVELLHTDSAEDTGLELGIVIIKKEHPSLLFHQKDALSWLFFCQRVNYYLIIIFMFCEPMRTITTL